jgi:hypothetical protein
MFTERLCETCTCVVEPGDPLYDTVSGLVCQVCYNLTTRRVPVANYDGPFNSADGVPHFTYYTHEYSFVWDGLDSHIEVCPGGYGEPVRWRFRAPYISSSASPAATLGAFGRACDDWIKEDRT